MREQTDRAGARVGRADGRPRRGSPGWALCALAAWACLALDPAAARAGFVLAAEPTTVAAGTGGSFEITLLLPSTDAAPADLGGFGVQVHVAAGSGVTFTAIDFPTSSPYVFGPAPGDSIDKAFGLALASGPVSATDAAGADLSNSGGGFVTLHPGDRFGLATVFFTTDGSHTGAIPVTFDMTGTSLSDASGGSIPFTARDGQIDVQGGVAAVPGPSGLVLGLIGAALLAGCRRYRRVPPGCPTGT